MGTFTGKCDFYDEVKMFSDSDEEFCRFAKVYISKALIDTSSPFKLIPYYTHIVSSMASSKDKKTIFLTNESWLDIEEREFNSTKIYRYIMWARKAKKNNEKFDFNFCSRQKEWLDCFDNIVAKAIIKVINENSDIIKTHLPKDYIEALRFIEYYLCPKYFNRIHDSTHNRMRENFVEYCQKQGYKTWKFENDKIIETDGEFSPIISDMCYKINEYNKMVKETV